MADAGWYPDPQDNSSLRYFDGQGWSEHRRPASEAGQRNDAPSAEDATSRIAPSGGAAPWNPTEDATATVAPIPPAAAPPPSGETVIQSGAGGSFGGGWAPQQSPAYPPPSQQPQSYPSQQPQSYPPPQQPQAYPPQQPQAQAPGAPSWAGAPAAGAGWNAGGGYPPPGGNYGAPGAPGGPGGPRRNSRRKPLLVAGVIVVVLALAGAGAWLFWPSSSPPSLTYHGKSIAAADTTLQRADAQVKAYVAAHHGAAGSATRCYFVKQADPPTGTKKSDVASSLRCGPTLFVDGSTTRPYLSVPLRASLDRGKYTLTPAGALSDGDNTGVGAGVVLARPDKKTAPAGAGGLKVPQPPAAPNNSIAAVDLGSTAPPPSRTGVITGRDVSLSLTNAGSIQRYGLGDQARRAGSGQQLIAFRIDYGKGSLSDSGVDDANATVVAASTRLTVPDLSDGQYAVASIPSGTAPVLQLSDAGFTQTLSLPDGRPGARNIAVLSRDHLLDLPAKHADLRFKGHKGNTTGTATLRYDAIAAVLEFWSPRYPSAHPSRASDAYLFVNITYTYVAPKSAGTYGLNASLLHLKLPNGKTVAARNLGGTSAVYNVFEVPASFTRGTVTISGSLPGRSGVTLKVTNPQKVSIRIAAG